MKLKIGFEYMGTYKIEAHHGLYRRRGHNVDAYVYWVNDVAVGTTIKQVQAKIQGPTKKMIAEACIRAKDDGKPFILSSGENGWLSVAEY